MKPIVSKIHLVVGILAVLLGTSLVPHARGNHGGGLPGATKATATTAALRDLWIGHVFWVRSVAVETIDGNTEAASAAESQAVSNAKAIAAAIEPFYGKEASGALFELLAGHYGAVKLYLEATAATSESRKEAAFQALVDNAGEIAKFLSSANPHLPFDTLNSLLVAHGGHHVQQIQQLQARQYASEAKTWIAMKDHMYVIADALAAALVKQFPEKF